MRTWSDILLHAERTRGLVGSATDAPGIFRVMLGAGGRAYIPVPPDCEGCVEHLLEEAPAALLGEDVTARPLRGRAADQGLELGRPRDRLRLGSALQRVSASVDVVTAAKRIVATAIRDMVHACAEDRMARSVAARLEREEAERASPGNTWGFRQVVARAFFDGRRDWAALFAPSRFRLIPQITGPTAVEHR